VNLTWTNTSTTQTGVKVERSTDRASFVQIAVTAAAASSYADTGLAASTTYWYRVRATNSVGDSPYSPIASATTWGASAPAVTYVQGAYATPQSPTATVSAAYARAQTAGDLNVVAIGWNTPGTGIASVTDTAGNLYLVAAPATIRAGFGGHAMYYARNVAASAAGMNTVTVTFAGAVAYPDLRILEYGGIDGGAPLDGSVAATGFSNASSSGALTTTNASDLLVAANYVSYTTIGPGPGYTTRLITSPDSSIVEDRTVSSVGTYAATAALGTSCDWIMQQVAFKAAGASGVPPTAPTSLTATAASSSRVDLAWANTSASQTGVKVDRSTDGVNFIQVAVTVAAATSYSDSGLAAATTYWYRVRATNASGDSPYSETAVASTPARPSLTVSPNPATVAAGAALQFTVDPASAVGWTVVAAGDVPPSTSYVFPLRLSPNGRYLVDQNGVPWRVQADAAWLMSTNATPAEVDTYLATRKAQGFNSFYLMAMVHPGGYADAPHAPYDAAGDAPFTVTDDFLTPNEPYWAWIDTIIDKAAAQGMVVMLAYSYLGYAGGAQGWATVVEAMSPATATAWGTWLGNRYRTRPNILWFACGDYTPPAGSRLEQNVISTIQAIRAAGAPQLFMAEMSPPDSISTLDSKAIGPYLDMNAYYGYGTTGFGTLYEQAYEAYSIAGAGPVWVEESSYEYENNAGHFPADTSYGTRRTRFWNSLAGGTAGDGFGSGPVWRWRGLPGSLNSPGAVYSALAFDLFATLPWWDLVPSQKAGTPAYAGSGRVLVTSGQGTWGNQGASSGIDWVTASVTSDGQWLLAYVPGADGQTTSRTIGIAMSALSAPARARWWNPTNGVYTDIGFDVPNTGTSSFTTPGANGAGANDWVLVLDVTGARCGTIDATGLYRAPANVPIGVTCQVVATLVADPSVTARATVVVR
jgi:hypothetical protein